MTREDESAVDRPLPPEGSSSPDRIRVTTVDVHTAGEPLRIITGGLPTIHGDTMLAKRRYAQEHLDHLRTALMWEPRGHADMYGAILTDPVSDDGDFGVLFLHNEGYSTMCGHGVIGLAMAGVEAGVVGRAAHPPGGPVIHGAAAIDALDEGNGASGPGAETRSTPAPDSTLTLRIDTPAGRVTAFAHQEGGRVKRASFLNVPSFVYALDQTVEVEGIGPVRYDVAFGGAFYAFCDAQDLGVSLEAREFRTLMDVGMRVKEAVMDSLSILHPFEPDLGFLYGTIMVGEAHDPSHHSRNVCVFADGEVDRCPTGTGVSARAALHHARGELEVGEPFSVESILGTTFTGAVAETTRFGPYDAVVPRIIGTSHVTGRSEFLLDPEDPLRHGFILR
jgi:trans-L-3-hydroxyproline dehydratase